jgi:zinc D-Ala-D-Ala dipeptidase
MPGFKPGIHVFSIINRKKDVDGRNKSGHDEVGSAFLSRQRAGLRA